MLDDEEEIANKAFLAGWQAREDYGPSTNMILRPKLDGRVYLRMRTEEAEKYRQRVLNERFD